MPFTGTHPLAVVPLVYAKRLRLDATCLVIGSMSPDFEYFVNVKLVSEVGHTLRGLFTWCLPVTLISAWLFHRLVKWPAVRLLPASLAGRAAAFAERPWMPALTVGAILSLVISTLLGAVTHDVWDSFTHSEMWTVRHIAVLRESIDLPGVGSTPVHRALQHGFSLAGSIVLAVIVWRDVHRVQPAAVETPHAWRGRIIWLACTGVLTAGAYAKMLRNHETDIGSMVAAPIAGLLGGTLLLGMIETTLTASSRRSPPHPR